MKGDLNDPIVVNPKDHVSIDGLTLPAHQFKSFAEYARTLIDIRSGLELILSTTKDVRESLLKIDPELIEWAERRWKRD